MSQEILREANIKLQKIYKQRQAQEKQESYKENFQNKIDKVEDIISKRLYNYSNVNNFIDEQSLSKTVSLMSMIVEGNLKSSSFCNKDTTESETQTGSTLLKEYEEMNKNLEKENEAIKKEKLDLISNNEILKEKIKMLNKEIEEKNSIITKNNDEIREVRKSLEKLNKDNLNCRQQIDELNQKNNTFQKINSEYEKLKSLVKENYLFTGRQSVTRTSNVYDRRISMDNTQQPGNNYKFTNEPVLVRFFKLQLMKYIVRYLNVEDIANMKLVNTVFFDSIDSDLVLSNSFFMKVIKKKNDRILELAIEKKESEQNISESYVVSNDYIESLINNYIIGQKAVGEKLKFSFGKSVKFIEVGVKAKLEGNKTTFITGNNIPNNSVLPSTSGTVTPSKNNTNNTGGAYSNYLGYFGGFFGTKTPTTKEDNIVTEIPIKSGNATRGNITPKPESPKSALKTKEPDLNSDYKTINTTSNQKPFDNLDNKLSTIPNDKLEFKYTPFDLVKLFKEFTKKKLDENEISKFFNELINWYSDLLYNVNLTLVEVKELNDLKIALNARYKAYFKHSKKLEDENTAFKAQIQKFSSFKEENELLKHSRYEEERKVQELKAEKSKILCSLGENQKLINSFRQKWLSTESEYLRFKQLFKNELRNLRFEYDESQQEKKEIVELLVKFKNFCFENKIFEGN